MHSAANSTISTMTMFLFNVTWCAVRLKAGLQSSDRLGWNPSEYDVFPLKHQKNACPPSTTPTHWKMPCSSSCLSAATCDHTRAEIAATGCHFKELSLSDLQQCLSQKTLIVLGDSVLREAVLHMVQRAVPSESVRLFPAHSFGSVISREGVRMYWDYIVKKFLGEVAYRDEPTPEDVLNHMVNNHIHASAWADRQPVFIIGGTSLAYFNAFLPWYTNCTRRGLHEHACPWKASPQPPQVVIKAPNVNNGVLRGCCHASPKSNTEIEMHRMASKSKGRICSLAHERQCASRFIDKSLLQGKHVQSAGFQWLNVTTVTAFGWSFLRPGDADSCGCHFGTTDQAGLKHGPVVTAISRMLAAAVCI